MESCNETICFDEINSMKGSPDAYHFMQSHQDKPASLPVVIILCVRRKHAFNAKGDHNYLRHFRKIYASKRWIAVQCTPSEERLLNGESDQIVASLMTCLESRDLSQNPLVIHLLGHQAIPIYNALTHACANEREDLFRIKGCIIDSGPVRPTGVKSYLRKYLPTFYNILMLLLWLLASVFPEFLQRPEEFDEFDKFCYNTGNWPQLYLYSTTDHVVRVDDVEHVMSIRHRAGIPIDSMCWHDTEHARHLFTHEQEYTQLCQNFVTRVT